MSTTRNIDAGCQPVCSDAKDERLPIHVPSHGSGRKLAVDSDPIRPVEGDGKRSIPTRGDDEPSSSHSESSRTPSSLDKGKSKDYSEGDPREGHGKRRKVFHDGDRVPQFTIKPRRGKGTTREVDLTSARVGERGAPVSDGTNRGDFGSVGTEPNNKPEFFCLLPSREACEFKPFGLGECVTAGSKFPTRTEWLGTFTLPGTYNMREIPPYLAYILVLCAFVFTFCVVGTWTSLFCTIVFFGPMFYYFYVHGFGICCKVIYTCDAHESIGGDQRVASQRNSNVTVSKEVLCHATVSFVKCGHILKKVRMKLMPLLIDEVGFSFYGKDEDFMKKNIPGHLKRHSQINIPGASARDLVKSTIFFSVLFAAKDTVDF